MKNELAQTQDAAIDIRQETENLIRAGVAENTIKAYQRAYDGFHAWLLDNVTTVYLINTSLTSVDMPEAQNLNSFQHDIPNTLPNAESLHTN